MRRAAALPLAVVSRTVPLVREPELEAVLAIERATPSRFPVCYRFGAVVVRKKTFRLCA